METKKYKIKYSSGFKKRLSKYYKKDRITFNKIVSVIDILEVEPFNNSLYTHNVGEYDSFPLWSSRVTYDIRILWIFSNDEKYLIVLIKVGTHDEVY